jgi:hypothetical protein
MFFLHLGVMDDFVKKVLVDVAMWHLLCVHAE